MSTLRLPAGRAPAKSRVFHDITRPQTLRQAFGVPSRATVLAFGVSLSIEFAQLILPIGRSAQIYDVDFNTAGGLVGGAIGTLVSG